MMPGISKRYKNQLKLKMHQNRDAAYTKTVQKLPKLKIHQNLNKTVQKCQLKKHQNRDAAYTKTVQK